MTLSKLEIKIDGLIDDLNKKDKNISKSVDGIPDLPYENFETLMADLRIGKARLLRFSFALESNLFSLIAKPSEKFSNNFGMIIAYGGILASIGVSYFVSWWLLVLIPIVFVVGNRIVKRSYNSAILRTAATSELLFCFLYFAGQVSIDLPSAGEHYYYKRE